MDDTLAETEHTESVEDKTSPVADPTDPGSGDIVSLVTQKYTKAKTARFFDEQRMMRAYKNYRGLYGPDMQFTDTEKSRIFVKVTKTKVLAAYQQITDVLFGNDRFPISIAPTTLPDGVVESVHFETQETPPGMNEKLQPGETESDFKERLGVLTSRLEPVMDKLKEGPGQTPTAVTFHPAEIAAGKMEKKIHDQLEESDANKKLRTAVFEMCLFGTGVMKGPFAVEKEYPDWDDAGDYIPTSKLIPAVSGVSIWNFYPDPDADDMTEAEYVVERHKLSRSKLRALKRRPFFRSKAIDTAVKMEEHYSEEWWENQMEEEGSGGSVERYEVLEFWGTVDVEVLEECGIKVPKSLAKLDEVHANIWICNGQLLRLVMNPYKPAYLPYHAVPYENNPYSFFGIGVAENMDDTQTLMNGFMRMSVDNAALSGNMIIEVDEDNLVPGQDMTIYPGKIFRRSGGAPGQAIFGTKFPNTANENMQIFDKARQLADEATGLPSFSHGQTGVTGVGRTSSGISMLMAAATGAIRTVVKNIDDYLLAPLGRALYHFNMQFDFDNELTGDLEVKARGTESLMAKEVRSQRLMQLLSIVQNPVLAPFAKMDYIIREISKSLDLDPDKTVNSLGDAAIQAEVMKAMSPTPQGPPGAPAGPTGAPTGNPAEGAPAVPSVANTAGTGNGNIGPGGVPQPGEQGFSANVS